MTYFHTQIPDSRHQKSEPYSRLETPDWRIQGADFMLHIHQLLYPVYPRTFALVIPCLIMSLLPLISRFTVRFTDEITFFPYQFRMAAWRIFCIVLVVYLQSRKKNRVTFRRQYLGQISTDFRKLHEV